jgi:hypothetical protein
MSSKNPPWLKTDKNMGMDAKTMKKWPNLPGANFMSPDTKSAKAPAKGKGKASPKSMVNDAKKMGKPSAKKK